MIEPAQSPDSASSAAAPTSLREAASNATRLPRPHANLPDDLGDIGDHAVGAPKDDVRRLRTRAAWARAWVALAVASGVILAVGLWKVSLGSGARHKSVVAAPSATDPASTAEVAAASRAALTVDSISPIAAVAPSPTADTIVGSMGAPSSSPLIQPFDPPANRSADNAVTTAVASSGNGTSSATAVDAADHLGSSAPLSVLARMQRADGFGGGDGMSTDYGAEFAARRSPLAQTAPTSATTTSSSVDGVAASGNGGAFVPGTRAKARILVSLPSAADGEPIEAVLEDSVVSHGVTVLPAGTRAIGRGAAFDDGTAEPRLMIHFTTFVLPDSTVKTLSGIAYAVEDDRIGLPVTLNYQVGRKAERIATAAGVAGAMAMATNSLPQQQTGSVFNQEPPGSEALRQAYDQTFSTMDQELGLSQPPVAELLKLNAGRVLWIVFGMPAVGGGPS